MESLRNNFINIWIPSVFYLHPLRWKERKAPDRFKSEARSGFFKKWGFNGGTANISDSEIEDFCMQFESTNIPWSKGKLSYDWEYLE